MSPKSRTRIVSNIVACLFFLVSTNIFAEKLYKEKDMIALMDQMMNAFVIEEFEEGVLIAKPHWPISQKSIEKLVATLEESMEKIGDTFGLPVGQEFILKKQVGDSLVRYFYLQKFQYHPVYWRFTFYKSNDVWLLNNVKFKDNLDELFAISK